MVSVLFKKDFRFNVDNIPDNIFRYARGNVVSANDELMFDVVDLNTATTIRTHLEARFNRPVSININANVVELSFSQNAVGPAPVRTTPEPQPARCTDCDLPLNECNCERCDDCHQLIDHCTCERQHPDFQDVVVDGSNDEVLRTLASLEKVKTEDLTNLVASKLDNDTASRVKLLSDKILQYNRLLSNLVNLQNEISRISSTVSADPIVAAFRNKIDALVSNGSNMIKDIYFTTNYLVVSTKDIITNPLRDNKRRKIGEMQFFIRLDSLLGTRSNETPILIRNCTREDLNYYQECGHVGITGIPCFGSWTEPILKSMLEKDLDQLVDLLIRYVRTPNEDDLMGKPIQNWPIVEENNETRAS